MNGVRQEGGARGRRLLLVGWDSADWKVMDPMLAAGQLPGLARLLSRGVRGNLGTLEPQLSPMLWTSVATGKHAYHHGVHGFTEVDGAGRVVPVSAATRRCLTLWEMLGARGKKSHVVSWFATHGERMADGCMVSPQYNSFRHGEEDGPEEWPEPPAGTYWPRELGGELNGRRVSPWDIDGEEVLRLFVPDGHLVDQGRDGRLWFLAQRLAESCSAHAAACWLMEREPDWDFTAVYYRAIDEISHRFMRYHPPGMAGVSEEECARYSGVVAAAYRFHDLMLVRLMELAGPEAAVVLVSDHGFHSDHLRPAFTPRVPAGITVWHRPQGVLVAAGPGIRVGGEVSGARLLDIAPTILTYFGLPVGADMEGRVLREVFEREPEVETVPTWEDGDAWGGGAGGELIGEAEREEMLRVFAELGYIDEVPRDPGEAAAVTGRENRWNLARANLDGGRDEEALVELEELFLEQPGRVDIGQTLAFCQERLGLLEEADETLNGCVAGLGEDGAVRRLRAGVALGRRRPGEALRQLEGLRGEGMAGVAIQSLRIEALLQLHRWEECAAACEAVRREDPEHVLAQIGLARCAFRTGNAEGAEEHALTAIGLQYGNYRGHFLLGAALRAQGRQEAAVQALGVATKLAPGFLPAWRMLIGLLESMGRVELVEGARLRFRMERRRGGREAGRDRLVRLRAEREARLRVREVARKEKGVEGEGGEGLPADREFVIVSGLPRSGTSLMMQMLRAGGIEVMTDGQRVADEDNPEGYWEWEAIRGMAGRPLMIEAAEGKAVKVISALVPVLPVKHRYRVIFMKRPVGEVAASQERMLRRRGAEVRAGCDQMEGVLARHAEEILAFLRQHPRVALLEVEYPELVADPEGGAARVAAFLGGEWITTPEAMAGVVRPVLYRQRGG